MLFHLTDRTIIHVDGAESETFLQNIMSNDIGIAHEKGIVYTCLLTPQGQVLADFFVIYREKNAYWIDIDKSLAEDLIRRLNTFKLRAKVSFSANDKINIYTSDASRKGYADPRHTALGTRVYTEVLMKEEAGSASSYQDFLISSGVPACGAIRYGKDIPSDVNLDMLNAIGWDKGCFIGQEVVARVRYRALIKKRLVRVHGEDISKWNIENGEMRIGSEKGDQGLAVVRLDRIPKISGEMASAFSIALPEYLEK